MPQQELPEQGELVLVTINVITPHGAYATIEEYGGAQAFLHVSEISTGWVRNIERFVKPSQKLVVKVIRANKARNEIDLSLRQVTGEERKQKLIEIKKADKAKAIMEMVVSKLEVKSDYVEKIKDALASEFGNLYDAFEEAAIRGPAGLDKLRLQADLVNAIVECARERITLPSVSIASIMEITSSLPTGIELIREALVAATSLSSENGMVSITYLGSPKYKVTVTAQNYKIAEKLLDQAVKTVKDALQKKGCTFSFTRA